MVDVIFDHSQIKSILKGWRQHELSKKKPDENILRSLGQLARKLGDEFNLYVSGRGLIASGEVHFAPKYLDQLKDEERVDKDDIWNYLLPKQLRKLPLRPLPLRQIEYQEMHLQHTMTIVTGNLEAKIQRSRTLRRLAPNR